MFDVFLLAKILKAAAHPDRLRILQELGKHALYVNELAGTLNLEQPETSQHLAVLKKWHLVACEEESPLTVRRDEQGNLKAGCCLLHCYSLTPEVAEVAAELAAIYTPKKSEHVRASRGVRPQIA